MAVKDAVLGASGFVGRRLVKYLHANGRQVIIPNKSECCLIHEKIDTLYYCVGYTADYLKNPSATIEAHVGLLSRVIETIDFDHIVYLSSTRVYDGLNLYKCDGHEDLILNPYKSRHLYDLTKVLGENLLLTCMPHHCSIARLSCVYDAGEDSPGFLSNLLQKTRKSKYIKIKSSPNICRDYVLLDDVVKSLIAMASTRTCGVINVASGRNTYNYEIADALACFDIDVQFASFDDIFHYPLCDIKKLTMLGIKPIETIIALKGILGDQLR